MCIQVYVGMCMHAYMGSTLCVCIYMCVHTCVGVNSCVCVAVYVQVCACMHECTCGRCIQVRKGSGCRCECMYAATCVQRPEDNLRCETLPSTLFEAGSLISCNVCQAIWPASFQNPPASISYLMTGTMGLQTCAIDTQFCVL